MLCTVLLQQFRDSCAGQNEKTPCVMLHNARSAYLTQKSKMYEDSISGKDDMSSSKNDTQTTGSGKSLTNGQRR